MCKFLLLNDHSTLGGWRSYLVVRDGQVVFSCDEASRYSWSDESNDMPLELALPCSVAGDFCTGVLSRRCILFGGWTSLRGDESGCMVAEQGRCLSGKCMTI